PRFDDDGPAPGVPPPSPAELAASLLHPPRQPSFYRLDLRLEKRWQVTNTRWWSLVVEVLNTTLNREVIEDEPIGPVTIPSIGVEAGF
ncbi:MAG TPA: energy transducer TonB, partial [Polyangiaceae bacterium]|nr:energy transducer TonB [Polyangiaceae bacterium]